MSFGNKRLDDAYDNWKTRSPYDDEDDDEEIKITKEEFEAYENVRSSGVTNMFDIKVVENLSGLERIKIVEIMANYERIRLKYIKVTK